MTPMRIALCAATVLLAAAACWSEQATQPRPAGVVDLKLLYVGRPGSAREKDFVVFLEKHFRQVATGDLKRLRQKQTAGYDVIILDYDGDGFKAPRVRLPRSYARPTVTVGVAGALICGGLGLKSGYL